MLELEEEIERWHKVSDSAIGNKSALMTIFLATVKDDLKDKLQYVIMEELCHGK